MLPRLLRAGGRRLPSSAPGEALRRGRVAIASPPRSPSQQRDERPLRSRCCLHHGLAQLRPLSGSSSSDDGSPAAAPRRRRRKRGGIKSPPSSSDGIRVASMAEGAAGGGGAPSLSSQDRAGGDDDDRQSAFFSPVNPETGELLSSDEYLALASMSPWVPCPDVVVRRVFEIVDANGDDVHADLGCGDGRLNFAAVCGPNGGVRRSWGVDVDENILEKCRERMGRRYVPSRAEGVGEEANRLEFLQADLREVVERYRERYRRERGHGSRSSDDARQDQQGGEEDDVITRKLSQSTIVTMYFVHDALRQLQPYLASVLGGRDGVRVVTVGYEMRGWEPSWVERVMGLTVFKYDMSNVSNDVHEWSDDGGGGGSRGGGDDAGDDSDDDDCINMDDGADGTVPEYLRTKQQRLDIQELNDGLRVHHDEALNDFAQFRSSGRAARNAGGNADDNDVDDGEEWEDFDDTEDPEVAMREAERAMAEARRGLRGSGGLMAGVPNDGVKLGEKRGDRVAAGGGGANAMTNSGKEKKARPVWKKP